MGKQPSTRDAGFGTEGIGEDGDGDMGTAGHSSGGGTAGATTGGTVGNDAGAQKRTGNPANEQGAGTMPVREENG